MKSVFTKVHVPFILPLLLLIATAGCRSMAVEAERFYAQRIDNDESQKRAIAAAISEFMGGKKVTLADTVFMEQSTITIGRQPFIDDRGLVIDGRHNNAVMSFSLVKAADTCYLRNDDTKAEIALPAVKCRALVSPH